jgi:hypothetical protein
MVLRLVPDLPLLWRTPTSVQFGSEPVVVLEDVSEGEDRLLATLAAGISETGFAMLGRTLGVSPETARALLAAVAPILVSDALAPLPPVAVLGDSVLARTVAGLLASRGVLGSPDDAALVVLVADWVLSPADHVAWLNRDVPHLPVVVSERSVAVGPFVEPGLGPCLYCVHLARIDADDTWPAVATQLLGRAPREVASLELAETASFVARRVLERLAQGPGAARSWRLGADGDVSARTWGRHPDCRCAVPAGTDWAAAPEPAGHAAPTRASAVGALA